MNIRDLHGFNLLALGPDSVDLVTFQVQSKGNLSDHLRALASQAAVTLRSTLAVRGQPVSLSIKSDVVATIDIPAIPLTTTYDVVGGKLVPTFQNGSNATRLRLVWTPPTGMRVVLVMAMTKSETGWSIVRDRHYLLAVDTTKTVPGWFRLPLPNTYADAQICMGTYCYEHPTIAAAVSAGVAQFLDSPWNSDLMGDRGNTHALFSFDAKTNNAAPPDQAWTGICSRVNNVLFERIVL